MCGPQKHLCVFPRMGWRYTLGTRYACIQIVCMQGQVMVYCVIHCDHCTLACYIVRVYIQTEYCICTIHALHLITVMFGIHGIVDATQSLPRLKYFRVTRTSPVLQVAMSEFIG